MLLYVFYSDLLPNREDPDPVTRVDRIIFTSDQKSKLEALFRKNKFPNRKEKAALAAKLDVPLNKVMVCLRVITSCYHNSYSSTCDLRRSVREEWCKMVLIWIMTPRHSFIHSFIQANYNR